MGWALVRRGGLRLLPRELGGRRRASAGTPEIKLVLRLEVFGLLEHGVVESIVKKVIPCQGEIQKALLGSHQWNG